MVPGGREGSARPARRHHPRLVRAAVASGLTLLAACGGGPAAPTGTVQGNPPPVERPSLAQTYRPSGHAAAGDVFVHLFEWRWTDIASECETHLGPAGFTAVQVSPPEEHSITPNHDWSERYQPVSYSIDRSRSGTRAEFIDMVNRCKAVGVGIYVDAVINHMTNFPSPGTGSNGTSYSKY
jgi:alpha-amylase